MSDTQTLVLPFGQMVETSSGLLLAEIDGQIHKDDQGNQISRFPANSEINFLIHHDPQITIVRVNDTAGGDVVRIGSVIRSGSQQNVTFSHGLAEITLSHIPNGLPSAKWYGRGSVLALKDGNKIVAPAAPCLGDLSYQYNAIQYRYRPPEMSLALNEEFPVDLVIEYRGGEG